MVDKRNLPKIERIKDGILNPVRKFTKNGFTGGDIVQYDSPPKTYLWQHWQKSIEGKRGKVVGIRHDGYLEAWMVCVDFFEDIGKGSCWKYGTYRHGRWLNEKYLMKLVPYDKTIQSMQICENMEEK